VRQVNGVDVGVSVRGEGVKVEGGSGEEVGGRGVGGVTGCSDGEQADSPTRSVSSIVIRFIA